MSGRKKKCVAKSNAAIYWGKNANAMIWILLLLLLGSVNILIDILIEGYNISERSWVKWKMHRFLGLPEPVAHKKRTVEDIKVANRIYDATKRKRTIVSGWKTEFSWIITDDTGEEQKLFCKVCRAVYGPLVHRTQADKFRKYSRGAFVVGSCNLKRDSLVTHEKSEGHRYAHEYTQAKQAKAGTSIAEKALQALNQATFSRLERLVRTAHAMAKNSRPISDFVWLCEVDELKGLDIGTSYRNSNSAKEFLLAISEVERQKIECLLTKAKYATIMSDGSTDVSVVENEIVYIHFALRGITHCYFLGLIACEVANAAGIFDAITRAMKFKTLSVSDIQKKLIAFAGDGASVNTGKLNGVIALFRQRLSSEIIMIQCMSHRLELAFKDATKKISLYTKVYSLLDELFKFYHRSSKQLAGLKASYTALDLPQAIPTRVGGTRWVSHTHTALSVVWKGYKAFVMHLSQVIT